MSGPVSEPRSAPVLVTGNPSKLAEARRLFPRLDAVEIELPEIQSLDLEEVLRHKAAEASRRVAAPVIVEETGLEVESLGGFPGPLVKWMLHSVGADGIARIAAAEGGSGVRAVCALLYTDGELSVAARGETRGRLVLPARGEGGFGWDPVFEPEGSERTYGEMTAAEKDTISHRGRAWRAFAEALAASGIEL